MEPQTSCRLNLKHREYANLIKDEYRVKSMSALLDGFLFAICTGKDPANGDILRLLRDILDGKTANNSPAAQRERQLGGTPRDRCYRIMDENYGDGLLADWSNSDELMKRNLADTNGWLNRLRMLCANHDLSLDTASARKYAGEWYERAKKNGTLDAVIKKEMAAYAAEREKTLLY